MTRAETVDEFDGMYHQRAGRKGEIACYKFD